MVHMNSGGSVPNGLVRVKSDDFFFSFNVDGRKHIILKAGWSSVGWGGGGRTPLSLGGSAAWTPRWVAGV